MKRNLILGSIAAIVMFASCKKDNTNNNSSTGIQGTYKLLYLSAKTNATAIEPDSKTVTISDYTTKDNQGTIVLNGSTFVSTGLGYSIDTVANYYIYESNMLVDSSSFPFQVTQPPSNSTANYQLIGADSIYFPQGSVGSGTSAMGTTQTGPSGGHYTLSGNVLTITAIATRDSSFIDSGTSVNLIESVTSNIVMQKQ